MRKADLPGAELRSASMPEIPILTFETSHSSFQRLNNSLSLLD